MHRVGISGKQQETRGIRGDASCPPLAAPHVQSKQGSLSAPLLLLIKLDRTCKEILLSSFHLLKRAELKTKEIESRRWTFLRVITNSIFELPRLVVGESELLTSLENSWALTPTSFESMGKAMYFGGELSGKIPPKRTSLQGILIGLPWLKRNRIGAKWSTMSMRIGQERTPLFIQDYAAIVRMGEGVRRICFSIWMENGMALSIHWSRLSGVLPERVRWLKNVVDVYGERDF